MNANNREVERDLSFIVGLSLASGALILTASLMPFTWMQGMMRGMGLTFTNISWIGMLSGSIIISSAIILNKNRKIFGALILAFAIISLLNFGGFMIGAILGIIAGGLAISK